MILPVGCGETGCSVGFSMVAVGMNGGARVLVGFGVAVGREKVAVGCSVLVGKKADLMADSACCA